MDIKAILLDFDGTALQRDQVFISCRNMYAIRQAIAKGIEIIPCTGRCEDMFPPQIEAEKRIRYWITASGTRIVDRNEKKVLYQCVFSPEESAQLCEIFENQDIYTEISAEGHIYLEKKINDHLERYPVPSHHVWFVESGRQIPVEQP
ncbi:MAG TPA: HAD hydrolase family protein, partial [Flexilinea sp.]|nr:HAD hydrolase family protein [Flexilinea sp.]